MQAKESERSIITQNAALELMTFTHLMNNNSVHV